MNKIPFKEVKLMKKVLLIAIILIAVAAVAIPIYAKSDKGKGSQGKASGDVRWSWDDRGSNVTASADFDAQSLGKNKAKGSLSYEEEGSPSGSGSFEVSVKGIIIDGKTACFWGETKNSSGRYADKNGKTRYTFVKDGGDSIRGIWGDNEDCNTSNWGIEISDGDIKVQSK